MASVQRIKRLKVTKLSLLDQPSSVGVIALLKGEGATGSMVYQAKALMKFAPDKGHLYLVNLLPNRVDGHNQWVSAEQCEEACHSWQEEGCQLDYNHSKEQFNGRDIPRSEAVAIENLIIQKGDPRFSGMIDKHGESVNTEGGWGTVVKLNSKKLLKLAKAGKLNTSSLEALPGDYELVDETPPNPLEKSAMNADEQKKMDALEARLAKLENPNGSGDLGEAITLLKALPGAIVEGLKKNDPSGDGEPDGKKKKEPKAPDLSDPKAARAHTRKLEKSELLEASDTTTSEGSQAYTEALQKMQARHTEEDDAIAKKTGSMRKSQDDGYSRQERGDRERGLTMADKINRSHGYKVDRKDALAMPTRKGGN